ncbi:MAG: STT3 domain-containing protein [Methanothrix sp.]|nr:STT3 domain-containing protein [Methanothrix sp.]
MAVVLLGLLLRLFAGRTYITEMGVLLPGYDEYYHMRRILYTVQNFPQALWFDSYLNYPYGLRITWPPLFDQISAALCLAAGQHGQRGVEIAASMVPPLIGIMAIVVVYLTIREVLDSKAALLAGFMTAIAPYYFLYTIFGSADHHCLEVLLWLSIALLMTLSLTRGRLAYALLAGLTMAALAYTWQGADVYIGLLLVFAAVRISLDLRERRGSEETTRMLLAAFGLALLLVTPFGGEEWMRPSFIGLAAMTAAIVVMYALSRLVVMRGLPWQAFPGGLLLLFIVFLVLSSLTGGLFGVGPLIASGVRYFWGGEMLGKIAEAEPLIYDADTFRMVIFSGLGPHNSLHCRHRCCPSGTEAFRGRQEVRADHPAHLDRLLDHPDLRADEVPLHIDDSHGGAGEHALPRGAPAGRGQASGAKAAALCRSPSSDHRPASCLRYDKVCSRYTTPGRWRLVHVACVAQGEQPCHKLLREPIQGC